ncbi:MAG: hydroxyacid dehydrogenase [Candidatus Diapherotrites archaeon]
MSEKFRVLVADGVSPKAIALLKKENDFETIESASLKEPELLEKIKGIDAIIVRSATKMPASVIAAADKLKVIGRAGAGVDTIDVKAATAKGIKVLNTPSGNTVSVAELTIGMLISLSRKVHEAHSSMKQNKWEKKLFKGGELYGKTFGIIGMGKIGREVAKRAKPFGVKIMAYEPYPDHNAIAEIGGVEIVALEKLLKESDFISIHVPLNDATRNLIGEKEFALMKPNARIANIARGGIVDEAALAKALREGKIAGAAVDVFVKEPPEGNELLGTPNILLTPHIGASTHEAEERCGVEIAEAVIEALKEKEYRNAVN